MNNLSHKIILTLVFFFTSLMLNISEFSLSSSVYAAGKYSKSELKSGAKKSGDKNKFKTLWDYKRKHFNLYSESTDIEIGEYYMNLQIKEFKRKGVGVDLPKHQKLKDRIEKIVHQVAKVSDKSDYPYEVHVFDRPDIVNAFCMPGGKIGVFSGLFDKEKGLVHENNDDELAAILAHEIAHATMRHATRAATTAQGLGLLGTVVSIGLGEGVGANAQVAFERVFSLGANLYFPTYSRKHEKEADQVGFYYMSRAGYNPQAAVDIWNRVTQKGGPNTSKTHFLASHPSSGERAQRLVGWLPEAQLIYKDAKRQANFLFKQADSTT